jgi:glycosyltransferase involved in cell wall biosynthesis
VSGRLEHAEVAEVMPAADALVMPSTFPEAFGMVPAEAAACGVPPVSAGHSGMLEVSAQLAEAVGERYSELLSFAVEPGAVEAIAARIDGWLGLDSGERRRVGAALAERVRELWGWDRVAEGVISAARGELDQLPPVAGE